MLSTCSTLNFSAQAITGRQTNWSSSTMTAIMVATPHRIERVSPALAAVWRYDPRPGKAKVARSEDEHLAGHQKEPSACH